MSSFFQWFTIRMAAKGRVYQLCNAQTASAARRGRLNGSSASVRTGRREMPRARQLALLRYRRLVQPPASRRTDDWRRRRWEEARHDPGEDNLPRGAAAAGRRPRCCSQVQLRSSEPARRHSRGARDATPGARGVRACPPNALQRPPSAAARAPPRFAVRRRLARITISFSGASGMRSTPKAAITPAPAPPRCIPRCPRAEPVDLTIGKARRHILWRQHDDSRPRAQLAGRPFARIESNQAGPHHSRAARDVAPSASRVSKADRAYCERH